MTVSDGASLVKNPRIGKKSSLYFTPLPVYNLENPNDKINFKQLFPDLFGKSKPAKKKRRRRRKPIDLRPRILKPYERNQPRPILIYAPTKYEIVHKVALEMGFEEARDDDLWDVFWTDHPISVERCQNLKPFQRVNHFPGMMEICNKLHLTRNFNRLIRLFPKDYNFYPKSWSLPGDLGEVLSYSKSNPLKSFICKPDTGCQGKGIFILREMKELKPFRRMICQEYLSKPYLIDGYKFDLRLYTLITSCDPLRIFVYNEGLARFATSRYQEPNYVNSQNVFMHLTNYAVNKHSRCYVTDEHSGSKRRISTLVKMMESRGMEIKTLWKDIDEVIIKTIIAAHPVLCESYRSAFHDHHYFCGCFELLGFDIILDNTLKPYLLEVNHSPSFHTDTNLDKEIKRSLVMDTFKILGVPLEGHRFREVVAIRKKAQDCYLYGQNYTSFVHPCHANSQSEIFQCMMDTQKDWESENQGNYRLIYPTENSSNFEDILTKINFDERYMDLERKPSVKKTKKLPNGVEFVDWKTKLLADSIEKKIDLISQREMDKITKKEVEEKLNKRDKIYIEKAEQLINHNKNEVVRNKQQSKNNKQNYLSSRKINSEKITTGKTEQTKSENNTTNSKPQLNKTIKIKAINIPEEKKFFSTKRPKKAVSRKSSKNNTTNNNNPQANTTINKIRYLPEEKKFVYTKKPKKVVNRKSSTSPKVRSGGRPSIILNRPRAWSSSSEESIVCPKRKTFNRRNRVIPPKQTYRGRIEDIKAGKLKRNQAARVIPTLTLNEPQDDIKENFKRTPWAPLSPPRGPRTKPKRKSKREVNEIFQCDSKTSRTKTEVNKNFQCDSKTSRTKTKGKPKTEVNGISHLDSKASRTKAKGKPKTEVNEILHIDSKVIRTKTKGKPKLEVNEIFHCESKASRTKTKAKAKSKPKGKLKTEVNEIFHGDSKDSKIDGYYSGPPRPMWQYDQLDSLSIRTRKSPKVNRKKKRNN